MQLFQEFILYLCFVHFLVDGKDEFDVEKYLTVQKCMRCPMQELPFLHQF